MTRRAARRDRGKPGIPGEVAGRGAVGRHDAVRGGGPSDGGRDGRCRRDSRTRAKGRREGKDDRGFGEMIELSGKVLKTRVI
jgi:hypothetical protein